MRTHTVLAVTLATTALLAGPLPAAAQEEGEVRVESEVVTSFDDTGIYTTLFLPPGASAEDPVPIVFRGHGWGGRGERSVREGSTLDALLDAGYAVLTWDERGFGDSGDVARVMSPDFERRDVKVLLDHVADRPEVLTEAPGDPVVGMTGGSYGGGYQLVTAAFDDRVDAIAPEITWNDLNHSLAPNGAIKLGWGQLLFHFGLVGATVDGLDPRFNGVETGNYEQELYELYLRSNATNEFDGETRAYFDHRSLATYGAEHPLDVPTLLMQGSVDTLFTINEAVANYEHVRANGAPAKLIVFCGGHVSCPSGYADAGDRQHLDDAILTWFARYLRGEDVDTGAPIEYRTNEGVWRRLADLPARDATALAVHGEASLVSTPAPTSEGAVITAGPNRPGDPHGASFEVAAAEGAPLEIVGIPTARITVSGQGPAAHLFVKLVDRESDHVVNLQEAAIRLEGLGGEPRTIDLDLVGVAYTLPEGHHLDFQVSTTSAGVHASARTPAQLDVTIDASIPVRRALGRGPRPAGADGGGGRGAPLPAGGLALAVLGTIGSSAVLRRR